MLQYICLLATDDVNKMIPTKKGNNAEILRNNVASLFCNTSDRVCNSSIKHKYYWKVKPMTKLKKIEQMRGIIILTLIYDGIQQ